MRTKPTMVEKLKLQALGITKTQSKNVVRNLVINVKLCYNYIMEERIVKVSI